MSYNKISHSLNVTTKPKIIQKKHDMKINKIPHKTSHSSSISHKLNECGNHQNTKKHGFRIKSTNYEDVDIRQLFEDALKPIEKSNIESKPLPPMKMPIKDINLESIKKMIPEMPQIDIDTTKIKSDIIEKVKNYDIFNKNQIITPEPNNNINVDFVENIQPEEIETTLPNITDNLNINEVPDTLNINEVSDTLNVNEVSDTLNDQIISAFQEIKLNITNNIDSSTELAREFVEKLINIYDMTISKINESIPESVKIVLKPLYTATKTLLTLFLKYPDIFLALIAVITSIFIYNFYKERLTGFGGELSALDTNQLLNSNIPSLLIDIRTREEQKLYGIPKLKKNALGKGISVPYYLDINNKNKIKLYQYNKLNSAITAAYISGQKKVNEKTSLIVMSEDDKKSRLVAKMLFSSNYQYSYILIGGFTAWQMAELPTKFGSYRSRFLEFLLYKGELLFNDLREANVLIPLIVGISTSIVVIINIQFVLEIIGVLGLIWSSYDFFTNKFKKPDDFVDDLQFSVTKYASFNK